LNGHDNLLTDRNSSAVVKYASHRLRAPVELVRRSPVISPTLWISKSEDGRRHALVGRGGAYAKPYWRGRELRYDVCVRCRHGEDSVAHGSARRARRRAHHLRGRRKQYVAFVVGTRLRVFPGSASSAKIIVFGLW